MRLAILAAFALLALGACAPPAPPARQEQQQAPSPEAEARQFMAEYAADLQRGDRLALAERYHRDGAYLLGDGEKELRSFEQITQLYLNDWHPPAAFSWTDLSYEPVGDDAVLVVGRFSWTVEASAEPLTYSYSALLRRQDGQLRIRMEDESRPGQ
jgi:hypothetical protein